MVLFSPAFLAGKNEQTKIAIALYDHREGLSRKELTEKVGTPVESIDVYVGRLKTAGWVSSTDSKPTKHSLTIVGRGEIEKLYRSFLHAQEERRRTKVEERAFDPLPSRGPMELPEQIAAFMEFFEVHEEYKKHLFAQVSLGEHWIKVAFDDLARFNPELAELLLERPNDLLLAWERAIEKMDVPRSTDSEHEHTKVRVRVTGLHDTLRLSSLGPRHVDRLVQVEAQVLTVSERRPMVVSARFECPSCGNVLQVLQVEQKFREPSSCTCGRKGKFKFLDSVDVPACTMLLVQPLTELVGKKVKPSQLKVQLQNDLTNDDVRDELGLNSMVRIVGIPRKVPIILPSGGQSTRFDLMLEAVSVKLLDHYNPTITLSPERIAQFKDDVKEPGFWDRLVASFFPRYVGQQTLKNALVCVAAAMPLHLNSKEARQQAKREITHVMVIADPGTAKSSILGKRLLELCPHTVRATGARASKAGLTIAGNLKDKENDLVIPQPGVLVNANMGLFILDEVDKLIRVDQTVLNEALADQSVTVTMGGISLTLPTYTCFVGFGNPKFKNWSLGPGKRIDDVVDIDYSLLTRTIIIVIEDIPDVATDEAIASAILNRDQTIITSFDDEYLRDFLLYTRSVVRPVLREQDDEIIIKFYATLRQIMLKAGAPKSVCARSVEQFKALAILHAKLHLRSETRHEDVGFAKKIILDALYHSGYQDVALNVMQDDIGDSPSKKKDRSARHVSVQDIVARLETESGKPVPVAEVIREAGLHGLDEGTVLRVLATLKHDGELFELPGHPDTVSRL